MRWLLPWPLLPKMGDVGRGLVAVPTVKVHHDVAAVLVFPNVKAVGICLAGVIEGIEVGHALAGSTRSNSGPALLPTGLTQQNPCFLPQGSLSHSACSAPAPSAHPSGADEAVPCCPPSSPNTRHSGPAARAPGAFMHQLCHIRRLLSAATACRSLLGPSRPACFFLLALSMICPPRRGTPADSKCAASRRFFAQLPQGAWASVLAGYSAAPTQR